MIDPDDGQELPSANKPRVEPNKTIKSKVLTYIISSYIKLTQKTKQQNALRNMDLCIQVTKVLFTCHTILRQRLNKNTMQNAELKTQQKSFDITLPGGTKANFNRDESL